MAPKRKRTLSEGRVFNEEWGCNTFLCLIKTKCVAYYVTPQFLARKRTMLSFTKKHIKNTSIFSWKKNVKKKRASAANV